MSEEAATVPLRVFLKLEMDLEKERKEKRMMADEIAKVTEHLRICDHKKTLLSTRCRHYNEGMCEIDPGRQCRQQCVKTNARIEITDEGKKLVFG